MAIQGPNGGVRGFVSVNRDVSEEVRLREALAESERRNKALLEAMPDMLFTVNARGRFLSFMPARDLRPFVPPEDFLGKTVEEILPLDVAHALVNAVGFCLRTGEAQTVEYQLDGDGGTMDFEARIVTLGADEVLAIVRDRTREANRERAIVSRDNRVRVSRNGELPSVLVVDRDMRSLRLLKRLLEGAGKRVLVTTDADEAFRLAEKEHPDVFLVDLPVFESDGAGFLSDLRRLSAAPVLVYGTADDEERAIAALRAGADDFITRPFSAAELAARVDLALRHSRSGQPFLAVPLDFGDLVIDPSSRVVTVSGKQAALTSTEYRLLLELAEAAGRVMTHDEILERVWGPGYAGQHEVLRAFVRTLRKKLGDEARHSRFLVSERGVGYKMARAG
jgi:two-component system KDP operon response regulator KdpE